ncbi:zinc finger BED domain-containing protein RICESLEEPER 4-like [Chenopodium quinoa]|uniref:zinc finger BED domain-containing protein RICESLEEPER 4-like n=1 Tax=Chenopodium quinoa TaxID=63459 RepID=UPI000B76B9A4|nr:zinc finger BED domain-containing protein RICESLEEPER 4-like [Chenopodium quinoa]
MESEATTMSMPVDDEVDESNAARKRKRSRKSKVWQEMTEGTNAKGERIAICKHCKVELIAHNNSGTSRLIRHLLDVCKKRTKGLPLGEAVEDEEKFVFDMSELIKEILLYVVEGSHSFSTIEEKGFRRMMLKANSKFKPFSRATLTRDLFSLYVSYREKIKKNLRNAPGRICLTTDNWKSSHTWQHYICITAHFIDHDWKLHKRIIKFTSLSPPLMDKASPKRFLCFLINGI